LVCAKLFRAKVKTKAIGSVGLVCFLCRVLLHLEFRSISNRPYGRTRSPFSVTCHTSRVLPSRMSLGLPAGRGASASHFAPRPPPSRAGGNLGTLKQPVEAFVRRGRASNFPCTRSAAARWSRGPPPGVYSPRLPSSRRSFTPHLFPGSVVKQEILGAASVPRICRSTSSTRVELCLRQPKRAHRQAQEAVSSSAKKSSHSGKKILLHQKVLDNEN
jgi:hypothetical protein